MARKAFLVLEQHVGNENSGKLSVLWGVFPHLVVIIHWPILKINIYIYFFVLESFGQGLGRCSSWD